MSSSLNGSGAIEVKNLVKRYHERFVVNGVSLAVNRGEVVGLLGPNGAGKTTTFYMIVGLTRPNSGSVFLGNQDITRWAMHRRARHGIGYLAQEPSIFKKLTVEQNLLAILELTGAPKAEQRAMVERLLNELDIADRRHQKGYTLSGGERRRTEIARTLVTSPSFILLDEPFTGIDPLAVQEIQTIVAGLKKQGIGILITDHNVRDTLDITDRAYIMYNGEILTSGTPQEILNDPIAKEFYLGDRYSS
jgi:lipopolysaccharide export system ATP-binding protein